MRLTKSLDIAFMILIRLAAGGTRMNARELSSGLNFPLNHVAKIIQILSRGGYIRTYRGKDGGVELAKDPAKIDLSDIIRLVEGPIFLMDCTVNEDICSLSGGCRLRLKLIEAQESMLKVFRTTSLASLLPEHPGKTAGLNMKRYPILTNPGQQSNEDA